MLYQQKMSSDIYCKMFVQHRPLLLSKGLDTFLPSYWAILTYFSNHHCVYVIQPWDSSSPSKAVSGSLNFDCVCNLSRKCILVRWYPASDKGICQALEHSFACGQTASLSCLPVWWRSLTCNTITKKTTKNEKKPTPIFFSLMLWIRRIGYVLKPTPVTSVWVRNIGS